MAFYKIRPKSGTASQWQSANPVLGEREIGFEYPSGGLGKGLVKMKMGDGVTAWNNLPYAIVGQQEFDITDYLINNLTSTDTNKALAAAQGKALNDKITSIQNGAVTGVNKMKIACGTITINFKNNNAYATLFTKTQLEQLLGVSSLNYAKVSAACINGDASLLGQKVDAMYMSRDGSLSITLNTGASGNFAFNYIITYDMD